MNWVCAVRSSRAGRRVALVACRQCVCGALGPRLSRAARFCGCMCVWRFMVLPLPRTNTRRVFLRAPRPVARPEAGERARAARGPVAPRAQHAMICQSFQSRALWGAPRIGACGLGDHPTSDLSQRESASRSTSEKSKQFGPDGAPFPSKTSITRGPPGIVIAVSLDPILPQR